MVSSLFFSQIVADQPIAAVTMAVDDVDYNGGERRMEKEETKNRKKGGRG